MYDNRVELDLAEYESKFKMANSTEEYLTQSADICLTLMDLLDNSTFTFTETEARSVKNQLVDLANHLLQNVKDE